MDIKNAALIGLGAMGVFFAPRMEEHLGRENFCVIAEGERKEDDGDIAAVEDGYVSLTPVGLDLVDYSRCRHIEKWLSDIRLG